MEIAENDSSTLMKKLCCMYEGAFGENKSKH